MLLAAAALVSSLVFAADAVPVWLVSSLRPLCTDVLTAARLASCLRGLAGDLSAFVSILLEFIVEEGSSSEVRPRQLEPIRCTRAAVECLCERADGQPVRAHLARFFLAPAGTARAFDKGDFRVRAFGGVFVFPVMARVCTRGLCTGMTCKSAFMLHAL